MIRTRALTVFALALGCAGASGACTDDEPLHIGVLLRDRSEEPAIAMAIENVNLAGGVAGKRIDAVWVDGEDEASAKRLAGDASILAVIGPSTSRAMFDLASIFVDAKKPIVSPSATSGAIFRAFGGKKFVWRTVQSDVAQVQTQLAILRQDGAKRVALIGSEDTYGSTFFDWFGFFATELGMEPTTVEAWDQIADHACEPHVANVLATNPDAIVAVPSDAATAICLRRALRGKPRTIFSDVAIQPEVALGLGADADGMEATSGISDPSTGFDAAYLSRTGSPPPPYAGRSYDAALLLAYAIARSGGEGGERLADALADVVDGRDGPAAPWDRDGIHAALGAIDQGRHPDVTGATGPLEFDPELHTDLVRSTYGLLRAQSGRFDVVASFPSGRKDSIYETLASSEHKQDFSGGSPSPPLPARTGLRAVIVATTRGAGNERHGNDARAVNDRLRTAGVAPERITLVDDPTTKSTEELWNAIRAAGADANSGDDALVYFVGHASTRGIDWQGNPSSGQVLFPNAFADAIAAMKSRRVLVVVDTCFAGAMAAPIVDRGLPRVLFLASARPTESSLSTDWDSTHEVWRSDEMSFHFVRADANQSVAALYEHLYLRVAGSHVTVYNAAAFGNVGETRFADFMTP